MIMQKIQIQIQIGFIQQISILKYIPSILIIQQQNSWQISNQIKYMSEQVQLSVKLKQKIQNSIHTESIQNIKLSYSYLNKLNDTGTAYNSRFFILNHGKSLGYNNGLQEDKLIPFKEKSAIPKIKYLVKFKQIIHIEHSDRNFVISFFIGQQKKQWDFECPSKEMTAAWYHIIKDNLKEFKKQDKNSDPNVKGKNLLNSKSNQNLKDKQINCINQNKGQNKKKQNNKGSNKGSNQMQNIYAKDQYPFLDQPHSKTDKQQIIQLKQEIYKLKQELLKQKARNSQTNTDAGKQQQKDILVKQLRKYMQKCAIYEKEILQLKYKYENNTSQSKKNVKLDSVGQYFQGGFQ